MKRRPRAPRGVSLIEGMVASVVLLTGMVGVLQGILYASQQNAMASRHMRASLIASEAITALRTQGYARLSASTGLLGDSSVCQATPPTTFTTYLGGLMTPPTGLMGSYTTCAVDLDAQAAASAITAGYVSTSEAGEDDDLFTRALIFYKNSDSAKALHYVTVVVTWSALGVQKSVVQTTALYDTTINQTNVEL